MILQLENSPRTAGTRRLLIGLAAVTGLVCGAGGAHAQGQRTRVAPPAAATAPTDPAPPVPPAPPAPSPLAPRVFALGSGPASYVFKSSENGREVELRLENNEIVAATIDGEAVPKDRIVREGEKIQFKNEKGETIFEHTVSQPRELRITATMDAYGRLRMAQALAGAQNDWLTTQGRRIPGPDDVQLLELDLEPPKVMLGVTMMEPDSSLRGHLGLEPGTSTLVGSVYHDLPAHAAGLKPYDIIVAVDGAKPADSMTIRKALREKNAGDEVTFTVIHRGKEHEVKVKLEKYDPSRFDETRVDAIAAVVDDEDAVAAIAGVPGNVFGIGKDPSSPATGFFDPAQSNAAMQRYLSEARAKAQAELERTEALLRDRSAQTKTMEERLQRMEEKLQRLLEELNSKPDKGGGGGAGAEPIPDELLPAKGLWAGRNPAA